MRIKHQFFIYDIISKNTMEGDYDQQLLLKYYLIKRIFLFFDEWLFYLVLIYIYNREYFIMLPPVLLYGISCIYTSYFNINKIEEKLVHVHQIIWLSNRPIYYYVYDVVHYCISWIK